MNGLDAALQNAVNGVEEHHESDEMAHGMIRAFGLSLLRSAMQEGWESQQLGQLVRVLAYQWDFKRKKTLKCIRDACPERVNVEFLDGLKIPFKPSQLLDLLQAGSATTRIFTRKIAACIEAEFFDVSDPDCIVLITRAMLTDANGTVEEIYDELLPVIESLNTVRQCFAFLKHITTHWYLEKKKKLVQQCILNSTVQDLTGQIESELEDAFPDLVTELDLPLLMHDSDVDDNGNIKDFVVCSDESEGEQLYGTSDEEEEEEEEKVERSTGVRNMFILDEADEVEEVAPKKKRRRLKC